MASTQVNLYEAKTHLSSLVERAAKGEEILIARPESDGKIVCCSCRGPGCGAAALGQNLLGLAKLPESFYEDIPIEYFLGDEEDPLREVLR